MQNVAGFLSKLNQYITKTCPIQCTDIIFFSAVKIETFIGEKMIVFHIFAKNIDCGYTLEPPCREAVLKSTHSLCFESGITKMYTL